MTSETPTRPDLLERITEALDEAQGTLDWTTSDLAHAVVDALAADWVHRQIRAPFDAVGRGGEVPNQPTPTEPSNRSLHEVARTLSDLGMADEAKVVADAVLSLDGLRAPVEALRCAFDEWSRWDGEEEVVPHLRLSRAVQTFLAAAGGAVAVPEDRRRRDVVLGVALRNLAWNATQDERLGLTEAEAAVLDEAAERLAPTDSGAS